MCCSNISLVPLICSGDEVWRPGGSIDQDAGPAAESNDNDGWGQSATSEEQNNPFGSPSSEADSGKFPDSDDSFCKLNCAHTILLITFSFTSVSYRLGCFYNFDHTQHVGAGTRRLYKTAGIRSCFRSAYPARRKDCRS